MKSTSIKNLLQAFLIFIGLLSLNAQAGVEITYIHNDALGSPVAGTDEQGNVKWRSHYQPYGEELLGERQLFGVRTGYTGHRDDPETGLTYMGARYYSPALGRFMGVDPVDVSESNPHSFNRYAYANNNPYTFVDPDGRASKIASLVKLVGSNMKVLGRLTKEQAVLVRKQGGNILGDTKQAASQIEKAAAGNKTTIKHKGHTLKDGSTGSPHFQTEGVTGHAFWGSVGSALIAVGAGLESLSEGIELVDPTTYLSSGNNFIDKDGNPLSKEDLREIYSGGSSKGTNSSQSSSDSKKK